VRSFEKNEGEGKGAETATGGDSSVERKVLRRSTRKKKGENKEDS